MLNPRLQGRLKGFLPLVRVGIDFGEGAGGIAVVQGNKILHAETHVDFHQTTLEQRRQLRRGRRTRHAKKMRLARLRSWVLRQKLPDGSRLPDPYDVMRDKRFQVQPGVFETPGQNPAQSPSWIDLAKEGKTEPAGFVKALTLIFQKRGYKWDAIALEEMTDAKLKEFLTTARIPSDELAGDVRAQIERRRSDPDDPVRGKPKVSPDELSELLRLARERGTLPPQPRLAEHRSVKQTELRQVIAGFGTSAGLPQETIERWQRDLCGGPTGRGREKPGLLNKVLRPARFENRLRTGCAWCGKPTPRKAKVRYIAYAAAVCNLRVREGRRVRPLNPTEQEVFWHWWRLQEAATAQPAQPPTESQADKTPEKPKSETVPKMAGIEGHLRRLGAQKEMARQLYDLLWNPQPKGRASLCKRHLEQAALGKTMKDAGVDWQTISVRKAPNPCREQHDKRVLHRLEQILFKPGKTGEEAWRYGPVQFITLEVPKPQTEQARKGEQKARKVETFTERLSKETGGVCIYCGPAHPRPAGDKDHIFPQSRGGPDVWDNLVPACKACNTEKGDRTPFEWLGTNPRRWDAFSARVEDLALKGVAAPSEDSEKSKVARYLRISERKRALLLSPDSEYPENPTALAHVGSGPRQFVVELRRLCGRYGVKPPRADYQLGEPFVQRMDGRTTSQLRKSWLKKADETTDNFPLKNEWDLLNHAQDAVLIAACPPHTWRDTIFCHRALRPNREGKWVVQPELAIPELAPDWAEYMERRTWPLVHVLGRYPVNWKRTFADQNFYQRPEKLDDKRLRQHVPLVALKYKPKDPGKKPSASETQILNPYVAAQFPVLAESVLEEREQWQKAHPKPDKAERKKLRELGLTPAHTIAKEKLQAKFPGIRHVKVEKQPGGKLARVEPKDGPPRKIQLKKASEAAVFWLKQGKTLNEKNLVISVRWPSIFQKFHVPRHDPPIPGGATILDVWPRHKLIWLDQATGHDPAFYRVKEFSEAEVTVLPENAVTDELAKRLNLRRQRAKKKSPTAALASEPEGPEATPAAEDEDPEPSARTQEIKLHRKDLAAYFESQRGEDANESPGDGSCRTGFCTDSRSAKNGRSKIHKPD